MATFAVTAIGLDAQSGKVTKAKCGAMASATVGGALVVREVSMETLLNLIKTGNEVLPIFRVDGKRSVGPSLRVVNDEAGEESIEVHDPRAVAGRRLVDLARYEVI